MVNYDFIAPYYDGLAQMVFGRAQREAERYFCKEIPAESRLLIVGGGTGSILETLSTLGASNIEVVFVEKSPTMLSLAKNRKIGTLKVEFVQKSVECYQPDELFDCIITTFFFDNFSSDFTNTIVNRLSNYLKREGKWIQTDFQRPKNWFWKIVFRCLEIGMYFFFRLVSNVKVQSLPSFREVFKENRLQLVAQKEFYKGMICTELYCFELDKQEVL
jgi:ubiquinone/menaquinone biosynthesis C-methylase UbiE